MRRWLVEREGATCRLLYLSRLLVCSLCISVGISSRGMCFPRCMSWTSFHLSVVSFWSILHLCSRCSRSALPFLSRSIENNVFCVFLSWLTYFFRTVLSVEILIDPRFGGSCVRYKMVWDVNCRIYIWFPCVTKLRELHCWAWVLAFWEDRVVSRFGSLYGKRSLHRHVDLTAVLVVASLHRYFQFCSILFASSNCFVSFRSVDLLLDIRSTCRVFITRVICLSRIRHTSVGIRNIRNWGVMRP